MFLHSWMIVDYQVLLVLQVSFCCKFMQLCQRWDKWSLAKGYSEQKERKKKFSTKIQKNVNDCLPCPFLHDLHSKSGL